MKKIIITMMVLAINTVAIASVAEASSSVPDTSTIEEAIQAGSEKTADLLKEMIDEGDMSLEEAVGAMIEKASDKKMLIVNAAKLIDPNFSFNFDPTEKFDAPAAGDDGEGDGGTPTFTPGTPAPSGGGSVSP
ncbi:MAG: hypothetical protein COC22_00490 [Flavobacteriaceae bacterium]|nr:MAG: hypothetical protein COC22_00490 [Flavobacteriaceae bacterium]